MIRNPEGTLRGFCAYRNVPRSSISRLVESPKNMWSDVSASPAPSEVGGGSY